MLIHEIIESRQWERFTGTQSNRVWFNSRTGQAITANEDGNHSVAVSSNPAVFGLSDSDLAQAGMKPGEKAYDYDGRVLYAAMHNGWVRIYIDARQPDLSSNAEALNLPELRRALIWYCEQIGTPMRFTLIVRHGPGDREGIEHRLKDADEIDWFIRKGTLPRERFPEPQTVQARQVNTTPHMFRRV